MGTITSGIGLISGINTSSIIEQLMALEARPKTILESRIESTSKQKLAYTDLQTRLSSIRINSQNLKKPSFFTNAVATSSNENILTATTTAGAAVGTYNFQVARLVTSQQSVGRGFSDYDTTPVGAGTITMELGGGELKNQIQLSQLNGGAGVRRGMFRVTDRAGNVATIDVSAAVTLDDVVKKINTSLDISVKASIGKEGLVLTDSSGGSGTLSVVDIGEGHTAADLGIAKTADVGNPTRLTGNDINSLGRGTQLSQLNDGRGVRTGAGADFRISVGGSDYDITIGSATTLGQVVDMINAVAPTQVRAILEPGSNGIKLQDLTGGGSFSVTALNGSKAAADLGIEGTGVGGLINGADVISPLDSVMISSLKGGSGLNLGTIRITDRAGASQEIDLSGAKTVQDILDAISNQAGISVTATLNASQNGIRIVDDSGGSGNITIEDVGGGTTAAELGIAGTFDLTKPAVNGANLQRQWISETTLTSTLNGGKGIAKGKFKITNGNGVSATIDLTQGNEIRLKHIIQEINSKGIGITASINANGDGLLLTDTTGGPGFMKVEDVEGSAAADLGIKGTATGTTIDGSYEKTITIEATDKLADVQKKINDLGWGMSAAIINDGSGVSPFRLSLTARNTGYAGRVVLDTGETSLDMRNLVEAQDAAVFVGGLEATEPLLITASRNSLAGVVPGVNLELHGVSNGPVSLSVSRTADNVIEELTKFTETFNGIIEKVRELTKFDTQTNTRGLLMGSQSVRRVEQELYASISGVVSEGGTFRILADVGLKLGEGAKLEFDEDKFREAYGKDPEAVNRLFTASLTETVDGKTKITGKGIGWLLETNINKLIDPVDGVIALENKTLDGRTMQFQSRISQLDKILASKRLRLEKQFAQMESVLASLQNQQQALNSYTPITYTYNKK